MCGSGDSSRPNFGGRRTTIKQPVNLLTVTSSPFRVRTDKPNHTLAMKMIIALSALLAVALAAPQGSYQDTVITKNVEHNNIGVDGYNYEYQQSDGHSKQESAQLKNAGTENEALVVSGSYTYVDPATNQQYTITYIADENGFQPQGAHIPSV